jgi:hypothetical protein
MILRWISPTCRSHPLRQPIEVHRPPVHVMNPVTTRQPSSSSLVFCAATKALTTALDCTEPRENLPGLGPESATLAVVVGQQTSTIILFPDNRFAHRRLKSLRQSGRLRVCL